MSFDLKQNQDLLELNSFSLPSIAEYFCRVTSLDEILEAAEFAASKDLPIWVLGGGSNVILAESIPGLCLQIAIPGRKVRGDTLSMGAGENWHQAVLFSLDNGLYGLENLALIPGQVGAAPIQNIGAYGVELAESVVSVKGIDLQTKQTFEFGRSECQFGYRDSLFKRAVVGRFVITEVSFRLNTSFVPRIEYAGIGDQLGHREPSAQAVCAAVIELRKKKLPDPREYGNAGSFFKNPVIAKDRYDALQMEFPDLKGFADGDGIKVSAAFLIDTCGLKGKALGGARVSSRHALVLENSGHAVAGDVMRLAEEVQAEILTRFNISLEIEPRLVPG